MYLCSLPFHPNANNELYMYIHTFEEFPSALSLAVTIIWDNRLLPIIKSNFCPHTFILFYFESKYMQQLIHILSCSDFFFYLVKLIQLNIIFFPITIKVDGITQSLPVGSGCFNRAVYLFLTTRSLITRRFLIDCKFRNKYYVKTPPFLNGQLVGLNDMR